MRPLTLVVATAGGWGRAALIAVCTALSSGLLLVAVAMMRLSTDSDIAYGWEFYEQRPVRLFAPLADPGTRGGTIFGVVVLTLPILALLNQGIRLGTTGRRRRYDALAVAGATRADLRRWAAIEVGAPATVGAVLGIGVWWVLREVLGNQLARRDLGALVPPVGPGWWTVLVVGLVASLGLLAGARSVRTRDAAARSGVRFPVGWLLLLGAGGAVFVLAAKGAVSEDSQVMAIPALILVAVGLTGLTPWLTGLTALLLATRTRSPALLLASRRLTLDPRPAARAALATGAAGLTLGVLAMLVVDVSGFDAESKSEFTDTYLLIAGLAGLAFLMVGISLAVHITDTVMAERRAYASLSATGFPTRSLVVALRWETLMATVPVALAGCVLGVGGSVALMEIGTRWLPWAAAAVAATLVATIVSSVASSALLAPVVREAASAGAVRTE